MFYPLKFEPVYKDYLWGGRNFEKLGRILPPGKVAESWEVSAHPDGVSIITNGEFKGQSFPKLLAQYGKEILGEKLPERAYREFPLLVKLIDAQDKLSVQVHPTDEYAQKYEGGYGKNEMWYVLAAEPGAHLIYGLVPGTTKEQFVESIEEDELASCLQAVPVQAGDVFEIPAGLVHGIGEGIILAEIQQSSNLTYRLYDYERLYQGKPRPLHIEEALAVIDFDAPQTPNKKPAAQTLARGAVKTSLVANEYFVVEHYQLKADLPQSAVGDRFYIYTFLKGSGEIRYPGGKLTIEAAESLLIPAQLGDYSLHGEVEFLKTYLP